MPKLFALAIRDSAADAYHAPLFYPSMGVAERWFRDEVNGRQPDNFIANHPEDFELQLVGEYDTASGEMVGCTPRLVMRGIDAVRKPQ